MYQRRPRAGRFDRPESGRETRTRLPPQREQSSREPLSRDLSTGLPNRWTLQKELGEQAWKAHRSDDLLLLILIRVDGDTALSEASPDRRDQSLRRLGQRIAPITPSRDLVGRWETDRLLLISRPVTARQGEEIVDEIRELSRELDLSTSIGVASNREVYDPPGLIREAENALGSGGTVAASDRSKSLQERDRTRWSVA